ncbi:family 43 glycosylhydrolase [Sorangium sp. So ce260]|uniref:family 43 glycosylhydrolase n=1 Tax=Sorangium sp. So ce260 TaxID=3133291 RepID=UPI003F6318B7
MRSWAAGIVTFVGFIAVGCGSSDEEPPSQASSTSSGATSGSSAGGGGSGAGTGSGGDSPNTGGGGAGGEAEGGGGAGGEAEGGGGAGGEAQGGGGAGGEGGGMAFEMTTYQNPVLPGDHPDMNIYREGDAFYVVGSNFHMMPAFEILRSTDLLHWERVTRVVHATAPALDEQTGPGKGTWGGFIVKAGDVYRVYYSIGATQHFSSAPSLEGPWSEPTKVDVFPYTPPGSDISYERGTGSDNSVFVDPDSGKTYMIIKNGLCKWDAEHPNDFGINLVTEIDLDTGMLLPESSIDMSFINWDQETGGCGDFTNPDWSKWAEGPTMAKRGDWYYYFVSTHTACGGQLHAWASKKLVDSTPEDWTWLGYVLTGEEPYAGVQHITSPIELEDGSWWAFAHSYDCTNVGTDDTKTWKNGDWQGLGREGLLLEVTWVDQEVNGTTIPVPRFPTATRDLPAPKLPQSDVPFLLPVNDDFSSDEIGPAWTTYGPSEDKYTVTDRPGWLRIEPDAGATTWVVQKDALHSSSMVAKIEFAPEADGDAAGIRVGNGYWQDEQVLSCPTWMAESEMFRLPASMEVSVARVMEGEEDKIRFAFRSRSVEAPAEAGAAYTELAEPVVEGASVPAPPGNTVWLKLTRSDHKATGWFSTDGVEWTQVGDEIDISTLDQFYAMAHTWIGNQAGMFATNSRADFDLFTYRDGFTAIPAAEANQQSGTSVVSSESAPPVLGDLESGDWAMYGSVDLGSGGVESKAIALEASSAGEGGTVEVWIDPLAGGLAIGTCDIPGTDGWDKWTTTTCDVAPTSGTHEVYLRVTGGEGELVRLASLRFVPTN